MAQRTKPIHANKYWNETGVIVLPHKRYRIKVIPNTGEPLRDANYTARSIEGEAWDSLPHKAAALLHGKRYDDANWFALIGTIDKQSPWIITDNSEFTSSVSGELLCYFNDVQMKLFYKNNSGWVVLEIEEI